MLGSVFAILLIILMYLFEALKKFTIAQLISIFIGAVVFYILLYNVTYNSDWDAYSDMYYHQLKNSDLLFNLISDFSRERRFSYSSIYKFHIFLMALGFFYFGSRFSISSLFTIICIYLLFQLIPLSNQIRYYVAFSFFLVSAYNLIVLKNKFVFAIFLIISLSSHLSVILMYPFLYLFKNSKENKYFKNIIICSLILGLLTYMAYYIFLLFVNRYSTYFDASELSSLSGGVFATSIWMFWLFFIFKRNESLSKKYTEHIENDIKYQFLYKLSIYSIIFYPSSLIIQILCHRYIMASIIVWITFILYSTKYELSLPKRLHVISTFIGLVLITFLYQYILPIYLINISTSEIIVELFKSNTLFYHP